MSLVQRFDRPRRSTFQGKRTSWSQGLSVPGDGSGVVPRAGAVAVRLLADRVGLTEGYRRRRFAEFIPLHDLGRLWVDVATMPTSSARSAK